MPKLPIPSNENQRLKALYYYDILDTEAEEQLDNLTALAGEICGTPISLLTFLEEERQWFKSSVGTDQTEAVRETSFCQYCIMDEKVMEVEDALNDVRFANNPLVTENPKLRFYAGYPLTDPDGFSIGTLCVFDLKPNKLNASQTKALKILAKEIMAVIVARKKIALMRMYKKFFDLAIDYLCIASMDGFFKHVNPTFRQNLGYTEDELLNIHFKDFVHKDDKKNVFFKLHNLKKGHKLVNFEVRFRKKDGDYLWMYWSIQPDPLSEELFATAHDITVLKENEILLNDAEEKIKEFESEGQVVDANLRALIELQGRLKKLTKIDLK